MIIKIHPYTRASRRRSVQVEQALGDNATLRPSFNVASSETTRERCHNCDDLWFQHRGADNVPQRFRKNTEYRYSSTTGTTGYHAKSREDNRSVAVEFVYDRYVWVEIRWFQPQNGDGEWEGFRTALEDLGCDIYINELTQEEVQELEQHNHTNQHPLHHPHHQVLRVTHLLEQDHLLHHNKESI